MLEILIAIHLLVVVLIDIAGGDKLLKNVVSFVATKGKIHTDEYECRILECSTCQVWWLSVFAIVVWWIVIGEFSVWWLVFGAISSAMTDITSEVYYTLKGLVLKIIRVINKI